MWRYYDVWLTAGWFNFDTQGGLSVTDADYYMLLRIELENPIGSRRVE